MAKIPGPRDPLVADLDMINRRDEAAVINHPKYQNWRITHSDKDMHYSNPDWEGIRDDIQMRINRRKAAAKKGK